MEAFIYKKGDLHAEEVTIRDLVETYGTPLFIYSRSHMLEQYERLSSILAEVDPLLCFAIKSNSNSAVINTFSMLGAGADVVSGGELYRARRAGVPADRIVFAGVGKTHDEIDYALKEGILYFTVESEPELQRISNCAVALGTTGRIAIRVNPDVDPKTHKYTSTGKRENKFGVDLDRASEVYDQAASLPGIDISGIHMHLGSPLSDEQPYAKALDKVSPLCHDLKKRFPSFSHIDIGGGLGIPYHPDDTPFDLNAFAGAIIPRLKDLGLTVSMEPGRFLIGNAGILVTRVEYVKKNPVKEFIIVDAAMNDLIRPALYEAYHHILPVKETDKTIMGDVVGPICESGDFFAQERELPTCGEGDYLAVMSAGAYAFTMASNYNSRGRAAEVMVSGQRHELVRKRETVEELLSGETIPTW